MSGHTERFVHHSSPMATSTPAATPGIDIGQLLSFDWALGVSVSSSEAKDLSRPFVSLRFRIQPPRPSSYSNSSNDIHTYVVELTLAEFQVQSFECQKKSHICRSSLEKFGRWQLRLSFRPKNSSLKTCIMMFAV